MRVFGGKRFGAAVCALATAAVLAAGCGGDGDSTAGEPAKASVADEPAEVFAERLAKLIETTTKKKDCFDLEAIYSRSLLRFTCPAAKELRDSMADFEIRDAEEFGTGAVVEYASGAVEKGATITLSVTPDRKWGLNRMGLLADRAIGTDDGARRAGYRAAVEAYLKAVRARDCDAYLKVAFVGEKPEKKACKEDFAATKALAELLDKNPGAQSKLRYEGGNGTFGFYSLELAKPKPASVTFSLVKADRSPDVQDVVLNVSPGPTAAVRRKALKSLEKDAQPDKSPPETSPQKKADG